jgi:hypothetical protein
MREDWVLRWDSAYYKKLCLTREEDVGDRKGR